MFIAVSKHTTAGAKRFVEDRGIDLRRTRPRDEVVKAFHRWEDERARRKQIEAEERRRARAAEVARQQRLARDLESDNPPARAVIADVARRRGFTAADIVGPSRNRKVIEARFDAIADVYRRCRIDGRELSLSELGRLFRRDHTTMIHALRKRGVK